MPEALQSDDYISISKLKEIFLDTFRFVFRVFDFLILSIHRSLSIFIFSCFIGLLAGYLYYWQSPRYFSTEMIVQSNDLSRKAYHEIIGNLNNLVATQSYSGFASLLKIEEPVSRQVLHIEALSINNETLAKDTVTKIGLPFKIALKTSNNSQIPVLQKGILYYLNNNSYLRLTKDGQKRIYLERLQFIEKEQRKLDSLKENYNLTLSAMKATPSFYNNALNPADIYVHSYNLAKERENTLRWLNNESQAVLVIDGFKSPVTPQSTSWGIPLLIGLSAGVLLGILLSLLSGIKKAVNKI